MAQQKIGGKKKKGLQKPKTMWLKSYQEFSEFLDSLPENANNVYLFFTGKRNENGVSWCMWCNLAEPVLEYFLKEIKREIILAYVDVGDKTYWRDPNCPFRTDRRSKLMVIPTMIKWKGVQRLEGSQCNKRELLVIMFEEE